ncbi:MULTISPECIES: hypothetical protein [unclassified Sphingobacterium]|uniref:tetratricopeptide repeat protein n=1 Tax=unclassified Sphingobacterium TaxID=2609468 RepID=UPI0025F7D82F|nr:MULTISPECIES: hypothetical protein [unclassified Sphingobacterium]
MDNLDDQILRLKKQFKHLGLDQNISFLLTGLYLFPLPENKREYRISMVDSPAISLAVSAINCYTKDDLEGAHGYYTKGIEDFAEQPFFHACRSLLNSLMGDDEGAFYDYQVAKKLDFNYYSFFEWLEQREFEHEHLDNNDQLSELNLLVKQEPSKVNHLINRALEKVYSFLYWGALDDYTLAISLQPELAELYVYRGALQTRLLRYDDALFDFDKAILLAPDNFQAYIYRAKLFVAIGMSELALEDFRYAENLQQNNAVVFEERATLYEKTGNLQLAKLDYDRWISLTEEDFYPYTLRAELLEKMEDWVGALQDYDHAIRLNPHYSDLYQYRASVKEKLGDEEGARIDLRKFEELEQEG